MNNYREMYEALLRGEVLQYDNHNLTMDTEGNITDEYGDSDRVVISFLKPTDWSIKPKTININGFEVPEPVREPLEFGAEYYFVQIDQTGGYLTAIWDNDNRDGLWLSKGLIHTNKEAAVLHAKALWSFTAKEGV